jgi:hypothetical protein
MPHGFVGVLHGIQPGASDVPLGYFGFSRFLADCASNSWTAVGKIYRLPTLFFDSRSSRAGTHLDGRVRPASSAIDDRG